MQESYRLDESKDPTCGTTRCQDSQQQSQQQWQQQSVAGQEPQNERPWTLDFARELSEMIYPHLVEHLNAHIGAQLEELRALVVQVQSVTEHELQTPRSGNSIPPKLAIEQDGKKHLEKQQQEQAGWSEPEQRPTPAPSLRNDASGSSCCHPSLAESFTRMADIEAAFVKHLEEDVLSTHHMPPLFDSKESDTRIYEDRPQVGDAKYPTVGGAANYPTVEREPPAALVGEPAHVSADEEPAWGNRWNSEQSARSYTSFPLWGSVSLRKTRSGGRRARSFQMLESLRKLQGNEVHRMREVRDAQITSSISSGLACMQGVVPTLVEHSGSEDSNDDGTGLGGYLVEQFIWNEAFCGRYLTMIITLLALPSCCLEHVMATPYPRSTCEVLGDGLLHLGALGGLLALRRVSGPNLMRGSDSFLVKYARTHKVIKLWRVAASRFKKAMIVLWTMGVVSRVASQVYYEAATNVHAEGADWYIRQVACLGYMWSLGVFMANVYSIVHACSVLAILVDNYGCITVALATLSAGVQEWNILQAVLRKVSSSVEIAFVVLQTITILYIALAVAALLIYGISAYWLSLSALLVTVCNATMFMSAAQVTERVSRVPPLLNSFSCGDRKLDNSRHHLVEYVMYSAAGFYVFEVRLTASTALKVTYISGMVVFGILTKLTASF